MVLSRSRWLLKVLIMVSLIAIALNDLVELPREHSIINVSTLYCTCNLRC